MQAYQEFGRTWRTETNGIAHVKMFVSNHVVIMGSMNWTVASRSNVELGIMLDVSGSSPFGGPGSAGRDYLYRTLDELMVNKREYDLFRLKHLSKLAQIRRPYVANHYPDLEGCFAYTSERARGGRNQPVLSTGVLTALCPTERLSSPERRQRNAWSDLEDGAMSYFHSYEPSRNIAG